MLAAIRRASIENGYFDGNFDSLNSNYYHGSVLKFRSEKDKRKILNLRCFFNFLAHHPGFLPIIQPLLTLKPNAAYKFSMRDFVTTLRHFLTNYRQGSSAGRTAEARHSVAATARGVRLDKTQ